MIEDISITGTIFIRCYKLLHQFGLNGYYNQLIPDMLNYNNKKHALDSKKVKETKDKSKQHQL